MEIQCVRYECGKFVSWPLPLTYINSHRQKQIYNSVLFSSLIIRTVPSTTRTVPLANRSNFSVTIVPNNNNNNIIETNSPNTLHFWTCRKVPPYYIPIISYAIANLVAWCRLDRFRWALLYMYLYYTCPNLEINQSKMFPCKLQINRLTCMVRIYQDILKNVFFYLLAKL